MRAPTWLCRLERRIGRARVRWAGQRLAKAAGLILAEKRRGSIIYTLNVSVLEEVMLGFMGRLGIGAEKEGISCAPVR